MSAGEAALLMAGGLLAGIVNTLAGGASVITVPLLVVVGLPGTVANGTNRVGIFIQSLVATWRFRAEGVPGLRGALPVLVPIALGSVTGALAISRVADRTFETLFGAVMIVLLIPILLRRAPGRSRGSKGWSGPVSFLIFLAIGLYGGAFQAGVGIALVFALAYTGHDLVRANSIKVVVIGTLTAAAIPVFVAQQQVEWLAAACLAVGFVFGATVGVRLAVARGERIIRPVLAVAVLALAGRMMGLY